MIAEHIACEDLALFFNACLAATRPAQGINLRRQANRGVYFLHRYVCCNYRDLYLRVLAMPINDFNRLLIVRNLLTHARGVTAEQRRLENRLITQVLPRLPANRVYRCFVDICCSGVNNRRTRAVMQAYINSRPDLAFHAVKYRGKLKRIIRHIHMKVPAEIFDYLQRGATARTTWQTPLFDRVRLVHYQKSALYELPFAVAETLAAKFGVPRARLLEHMKDRLTAKERFRLNDTMTREKVRHADAMAAAPLITLANAALALPPTERARFHTLLQDSAAQTAAGLQRRYGRVALVVDNSDSSFRRNDPAGRTLPLGLALAYVLPHCTTSLSVFWTCPPSTPLMVVPRGVTNLALPLIDALQTQPDTVLIVSDGYENTMRGGADLAVQVARRQFGLEHRVRVVHINPTFNDQDFQPLNLGPHITTVGVREPAFLDFAMEVAAFQEGLISLKGMQRYLEQWVAAA